MFDAGNRNLSLIGRFFLAVLGLAMFSSANATVTLSCGGEMYSMMFNIGLGESDSDDAIVGLGIHRRGTGVEQRYWGSDFESSFIFWPENETNFERNRLAVVFRGDDGREIRITAQGEDGTLAMGDEEYSIECQWYK